MTFRQALFTFLLFYLFTLLPFYLFTFLKSLIYFPLFFLFSKIMCIFADIKQLVKN